MNTPIEKYFDQIIVINLKRRQDRWDHVVDQMKKLGITEYLRFEAYDKPIDHNGQASGNMGCTASHRAVMEIVQWEGWNRTLVFEDDFAFCQDNAQGLFEKMIPEVPNSWQCLYLGGHYMRKKESYSRVSPHVIRVDGMLTTSSFAYTKEFARAVAPNLSGVGPIDNLISGSHAAHETYILQPRIFVQYPNWSDLQEQHASNHQCMLDKQIENSV